MKNLENITLQDALDAKKSGWEVYASTAQKKMLSENIKSIIDTDFKKNAITVGEQAIDFTLKNALGKDIDLQAILDKGPVILTWYRGGWCPYCNLTLQFLQNSLSEFKKYGANLLALTPELPDKSLSTTEKYDLQFEVLSDVGNNVAKQYNLVYKLIDSLAEVYKDGVGLQNYNGDDSSELPITATYVIDKKGIVQYTFLDADYRKRASILEILTVLRSLQAE